MSKEAMTQALEALVHISHSYEIEQVEAAIEALQAALAAPQGGFDQFLALAESAGIKTIHDIPGLIPALKATEAQAAPQEPVAWLRGLLDSVMTFRHDTHGMMRGGDYVRADALIEVATHTASPSAPDRAEPTDEQIKLLDPWMRPAAAKELLTQVLALRGAA